MDFLHISGFDIPPGKNQAFQAWVRKNFKKLSAAMPDGIKLVGIYASIFASEKESGSFKMVIRLDSYGALDRFAASAASDPELARLLNEYGAFGDVRLGAHYSNELLKSVMDVTIWSDHPEE